MAVPEEPLEEIEMTRWEWTDVHSLPVLWSMRGARARMIWTDIEELDAVLLTLLAPRERIFWNFGENHRAFLAGRARYALALQTGQATVSRVDELCREVGAARASFLADIVFAGLTRLFGDRYGPADIGTDHYLRAQRHVSVVVPSQCREAVSRYFRRQAGVFGDSAFLSCRETVAVVGGAEPDAVRAALAIGVEALNGQQRRDAIAWLAQALDGPDPRQDTGLALACTGTVLALFRAPAATALDEVAELLRLRVRFVVECGALSAVEATRATLATPGWDAVEVADLRELLIGALDARLCPYPILQTDPYAAWKPEPR